MKEFAPVLYLTEEIQKQYPLNIDSVKDKTDMLFPKLQNIDSVKDKTDMLFPKLQNIDSVKDKTDMLFPKLQNIDNNNAKNSKIQSLNFTGNHNKLGTLSNAIVVGNINLNDVKEILEISKDYKDLLQAKDVQIDKLLSLVEILAKK